MPVYAGYDAAEVKRALKRKEEPSYQGTFTGAKRYVLQTFANTQSPLMKKRVAQYLLSARVSAMSRQAASTGPRCRSNSQGWTSPKYLGCR